MARKKFIFIAIAVVLTAGMLAISGCGKKKQPEVQTMVASDVTSSSATLSGMLVDDGNDHIASLGFYYSTDREMGDKQTAICNDYDGSESYSVTISNLQSNTTYYYQAYAENGKGVGVGRVLTFATSSFSSGGSSGGSQGGGTPTPTPTPGQLNGHAYVDLDLPSGTLWATCNVGAETPEGYGNYYAWGETTPKSYYDWSNYRWCNGSQYTITKYCNNLSYSYDGSLDNLMTLEASDDAATVNWGSGWRTPTEDEIVELRSNCTVTQVTQNGVAGHLFTARNGNAIFMPAAGFSHSGYVDTGGVHGLYWTSTLCSTIAPWRYCIDLDNSALVPDGGGRYFGQTVRPVCSANAPYVQSYTVNFNANGGTGYMQQQTFRQGVSQALSANGFYRDGYTFSGWNTAANGNGISYSNRQTITVNSNMTLYAQWTANGGSQGAYFTDSRDGNRYSTIILGEQTWMAENLRYEGDIPIGTTTSLYTAYRYYPNNDADNVAHYGYLYNWKAAMNYESTSDENPSGVQGICPNGWHLPSDSEWRQLVDFLGGQSTAGAKMAGYANLWRDDVLVNSQYFGLSGFNASPSGYYDGNYAGFGLYAPFWTSTEDSYNSEYSRKYAYERRVYYNDLSLYWYGSNKFDAIGVRCVRDN